MAEPTIIAATTIQPFDGFVVMSAPDQDYAIKADDDEASRFAVEALLIATRITRRRRPRA